MTEEIRCPECGGATTLRKSKKGSNAGKQFHVCADYPWCNGKIEYTPQIAQTEESLKQMPLSSGERSISSILKEMKELPPPVSTRAERMAELKSIREDLEKEIDRRAKTKAQQIDHPALKGLVLPPEMARSFNYFFGDNLRDNYPGMIADFRERVIFAILWLGLIGAGAGATWACALNQSAGIGALCGGLVSVIFAVLLSPTYAGNHDRYLKFTTGWHRFLKASIVIGLIVWLIRWLT
jgi:ssDNA-binding Zn-finger/Zn-ribbon topoisomerase 1